MTGWTRTLKKMTAVLLLPLAFFAGSAFATDLMSCRAQGVVATSCCCPTTSVSPPVDDHPRLEQGCCERLTLSWASDAPAPSTASALTPAAPPAVSVLEYLRVAFVEATYASVPRAERVPDATGPPLRVLHCSYLT